MPFDPHHGHEALRRGRWSESGAEYFLTFCTAGRRTGLTEPTLLKSIWLEAERLEAESVWNLRTGVVMPDHVHLLVEISARSGLTAAVLLFKGRLVPILRGAVLRWQPAYFDHRLRPDEDRLPVFRYIFLNPYRANLLNFSEKWPGYYCCPLDWAWFAPLTDKDGPLPEWLAT